MLANQENRMDGWDKLSNTGHLVNLELTAESISLREEVAPGGEEYLKATFGYGPVPLCFAPSVMFEGGREYFFSFLFFLFGIPRDKTLNTQLAA